VWIVSGCVVPEAHGDRVALNCNECGASVGYIIKGILGHMVTLECAHAAFPQHLGRIFHRLSGVLVDYGNYRRKRLAESFDADQLEIC
jgi:hypothetical protein